MQSILIQPSIAAVEVLDANFRIWRKARGSLPHWQWGMGEVGDRNIMYAPEAMLASPSAKHIPLFVMDTLTSSTIAKTFVRRIIQREEILVESWNAGNIVERNVHTFTSATNYFDIQFSTAFYFLRVSGRTKTYVINQTVVIRTS